MLQLECQWHLSWAAWSRDREVMNRYLHYPAASLVCLPPVLAAGRAAVAGLAPAGKDTMLQVSLGRMEFIYLHASADVSGSWQAFPRVGMGKRCFQSQFGCNLSFLWSGVFWALIGCVSPPPLYTYIYRYIFFSRKIPYIFKRITFCLCICSQSLLVMRKCGRARRVMSILVISW